MEASEISNIIMLHEDGDLGFYNRSNRSIYNFLEWSLGVLVILPYTSFVYPFPSFVCFIVYCLGRIVYQIGYTRYGFGGNAGYGGHFPGFLIQTLCGISLMGLLIIAGFKSI